MSTGNVWLDGLIAFLVLAGGAFALIGSIGLARFPDFFTRLHGPSKATTLGIGGMIAAAAFYFSVMGQGLSLHELLITVFICITTPISAHLLSKAALHRHVAGAKHLGETSTGESRPRL